MCVRFYSWLMVALALRMSSGSQVDDVSGLSTNQVLPNPLSIGPFFSENTLQRTQFDPDLSLGMRRMYLTDQRVTCNDGSPAGYYIRKTPGSKRWIIFLEGGMYCYDFNSCARRWNKSRTLMSSQHWSDVRHAGGILSPNSDENPYWWNSNHVMIPYCSSDSWSGAQGPLKRRLLFSGSNVPRFSFMGSYIVSQVVNDLLPQGLINGTKLILAGSSAGGTGVMLNLDRVANSLRRVAPKLDVRGLSDSGWFIDRAPFPNEPDPKCRDKGTCEAGPATVAIQHAIRYWEGRVPEVCALEHPREKWKCYFGKFVYPSIKTPLFIFQWLFDEAQISADRVGAPTTKQQWDYIHSMGDSLRKSLENVTAYFIPSCIAHTVLTKDWKQVQINSIGLPETLACWEMQPTHKVVNKHHSSLYNKHLGRHRHGVLDNTTSPLYMLADAPADATRAVTRTSVDLSERVAVTSINRAKSKERGGKKRCKSRNSKDKNQHDRNERGQKSERRCRNKNKKNKEKGLRLNQRGGKQEKGQNKNKKRNLGNSGRGQRSLFRQCHFRVIERCAWPQCNYSCPKLTNPVTGEEIDLIDLLKSFGLNLSNMAKALGIDIDTLHSMGRKELINLLTQNQAN